MSTSSDSEERPAVKPLTFHLSDIEPYRHLKRIRVVDGVTRRAVNGGTTLATLYNYDDPAVDNALVKNFAGIVEPKVPCQIQVGDGTLFPPTTAVGEHGYRFKVTYNKLGLAPTVRLEFEITATEKISAKILAKCAIEFHFNEYDDDIDPDDDSDEGDRVRGYRHDTSKSTITFTTGRATCSGYNVTSKLALTHTEKYQEVMAIINSFLETDGTRRKITLYLEETGLSPAQKTQLSRARARLPNGSGPLTSTIGRVDELQPWQLTDDEAPLPFVPLECGTTFSTVKEAGVQLAYSATIAEAECREALMLWEKVTHKGQIFLLEKFVVLGVNFRPFSRLGGPKGSLQFRLPRELSCDFSITIPGKENPMRLKGTLMSSHPGSGIASHDAFFHITSDSVKRFKKIFKTEKDQKFDFVECSPHHNSFTYSSQLEAVRDLQSERNARWHGILLNQVHDVIKTIDITGRTDPVERKKADEWLLNWMNWNAEQLEVIKGIRAAKGGMVIVMGPAATGKTLLQRALAIYFYSLGFHILSLAPANANCNKMAADMRSTNRDGLPMDVEALRLFPGSRDIAIEEMTDEQRERLKVGHQGGNVLPFPEFLIALDERGKEKEGHRECGVVEAVIKAAEEGKLKLYKAKKTDDRSLLSPDENAWDVLREFIERYDGGHIPVSSDMTTSRYNAAYQACKGQIVGLNRFMITTTGNVRSDEMISHWCSKQSDYGVPRKGVMVFVDEAAKDLEVNVWSGIVCAKWTDLVKGVFLFGDDKQLQPPNTSEKGEVKFNYYSDRLDMPLPNRLVQEGFPCHYLVEQRRMHRAISSFPNRKIYGGKLRDGPGMDISLDDHMPGLRKVLEDVVADSIHGEEAQARFRNGVKDDDLRRHHVEVKGVRFPHPSTNSLAVKEHVGIYFTKIFPPLLAFLKAAGKSVNKEVMIICAYNHQRGLYLDRFRALRDRDTSLTADDIPRVVTIDSSQGDESFMVFVDGSAQHGDVIGHFKEDYRFNVAVTRAKGVLWTIGGDMTHRFGDSIRPANLATEYKMELDAAGQTHHFCK